MQAIILPINSISGINEFIPLSYLTKLLSLTDLSLIYSCRLHGQSICHATRSINLRTGCMPHDQEICLSATQLISLHTSCVLRDGGTCLSATQLINLHTS